MIKTVKHYQIIANQKIKVIKWILLIKIFGFCPVLFRTQTQKERHDENRVFLFVFVSALKMDKKINRGVIRAGETDIMLPWILKNWQYGVGTTLFCLLYLRFLPLNTSIPPRLHEQKWEFFDRLKRAVVEERQPVFLITERFFHFVLRRNLDPVSCCS